LAIIFFVQSDQYLFFLERIELRKGNLNPGTSKMT